MHIKSLDKWRSLVVVYVRRFVNSTNMAPWRQDQALDARRKLRIDKGDRSIRRSSIRRIQFVAFNSSHVNSSHLQFVAHQFVAPSIRRTWIPRSFCMLCTEVMGEFDLRQIQMFIPFISLQRYKWCKDEEQTEKTDKRERQERGSGWRERGRPIGGDRG